MLPSWPLAPLEHIPTRSGSRPDRLKSCAASCGCPRRTEAGRSRDPPAAKRPLTSRASSPRVVPARSQLLIRGTPPPGRAARPGGQPTVGLDRGAHHSQRPPGNADSRTSARVRVRPLATAYAEVRIVGYVGLRLTRLTARRSHARVSLENRSLSGWARSNPTRVSRSPSECSRTLGQTYITDRNDINTALQTEIAESWWLP